MAETDRSRRRLRRRNTGRLVLAAALFMAAGLMLFPWCATAAVTGRQISTILTYGGLEVDEAEEGSNEAAFEAARAYNEDLSIKQRTEPFHYQGESADDPTYESLLNSGGIMCLLEVPSISLTVPVTHGTGSEELQTAAGHFYGTSLPCGGVSSHAGIAAHSGLPDARLFTDLEKLSEGDCFYIHILNETHVYRVDSVTVVVPEEADQFLQIIDGRDLVTLYTCTPYGLNTHRLLVRGERDLKAEEALKARAEEIDQDRLAGIRARLQRQAYKCLIKLVLFSAVLTAASFGTARYLSKKRSLDSL